MRELTFTRNYNGYDIVFSTDVKHLQKCNRSGLPVVLILTDNNTCDDTSFIRFAITLSDEEFIQPDEYPMDNDFLDTVIARHLKMPKVICRDGAITIRELKPDDSGNLVRIYNEGQPYIEKFYDNDEESYEYLLSYTNGTYDLYGFGIWGISLHDSDDIMGIVGFTSKSADNNSDLIDIELGYALSGDFRGRGIAYKACQMVIEYARRNIEYNSIIIRVDNANTAGKNLAQKLAKKFSVTLLLN